MAPATPMQWVQSRAHISWVNRKALWLKCSSKWINVNNIIYALKSFCENSFHFGSERLTVSMFGTDQNVFLNSRSHWNWIKFAKQRKCHVPGTECFWHSHRDQHRHRSTWSRISPQPAVGNLSQNSCLPYTAGIGWRGLEKQCKVLIKPQPFHQGHKQANQIYRQYVCVREQSAPVKIKWPVFSKVPEDQQRELNSYFLALYTRLMWDLF